MPGQHSSTKKGNTHMKRIVQLAMGLVLAVALTGWFVVAWYRLGGRLRAILTLTVSIQCTLGLWQSLFRGSLVATLIHHGISVLLLAGMLWITEAERGGALETVGANGGEP